MQPVPSRLGLRACLTAYMDYDAYQHIAFIPKSYILQYSIREI